MSRRRQARINFWHRACHLRRERSSASLKTFLRFVAASPRSLLQAHDRCGDSVRSKSQASADAVDASFVSATGSLTLGQLVFSAFLPSTKVVSYGSDLMVAMFFLSACVGFDGAWKDWNDHTYTAHNRLLRVLPLLLVITTTTRIGALRTGTTRIRPKIT